jgi:hypothetical protein
VAETPERSTELTDGDKRTVRIAATDLQQARRKRAQIRADGDDVAVILDIVVAVAGDYRSARSEFGGTDLGTVEYAGTIDGLAGLIADIAAAGVADGVTLIAASRVQDLRAVGLDVLDWLALRGQPRAS